MHNTPSSFISVPTLVKMVVGQQGQKIDKQKVFFFFELLTPLVWLGSDLKNLNIFRYMALCIRHLLFKSSRDSSIAREKEACGGWQSLDI